MTEQPTERSPEDGTWEELNDDHVHTVHCSPFPELVAGAAFALYHYKTAPYGTAATFEEFQAFWNDKTDEERQPYVADARVATAGVVAVLEANHHTEAGAN